MSEAPRTRDVMLREAARLFAQHGFRGTSVSDIGLACGISGPAFYKHFASKDALLARLLGDISEQLLNGARQVLAEHPAAETALPALVEFHTAFALAEPDVIRVQDRDLASLNERDRRVVRRLQSDYVEVWTSVLRRLEPDLELEVAQIRAHAVFGLLNSTPHSARGRAEARRQLTAMALRAFGRPPA